MSHFTFDERKIINSMITQGYKCIEIANRLGKDPIAISKEIRRSSL